MAKICEECARAIFCPSWGEHKCELRQTVVPTRLKSCDDFEKKKKDSEERKCHCLTCMAEGYIDNECQ